MTTTCTRGSSGSSARVRSAVLAAEQAGHAVGDPAGQLQRLVGQGPQLLGRDVLLAHAPGDLLEARRVRRQALAGPAHCETPAASVAMRPRIPLTSPGASAWQ